MARSSKSQRIDLWTPVVADDKQHHNFRGILQAGGQAGRDVISSWADGFTDRDGKFVREFQTTFDSAFWELYLFACFKELGLSPALDHHAPDFMITVGDAEVAAEATIAREAEGFRPEWDKYDLLKAGQLADLAQRLRYTTIRLASRFVSKVEEYRQKYAQLPHVKDKPFILCIAPFDQPFTFDLAQQAMRRVLFRADTPIFHRDPKTGEAIVLGISEVDSVLKDAGAEIPMGMFCDASFPEVSAVLFSTTATWSKVRALSADPEERTLFRAERYNAYGTIPLLTVAQKPHYVEELLDGLILSANPFASHPIDLEPFDRPEIAFESWDPPTQAYFDQTPHEWLIRRFCFTMRETDDPKQRNAPPKAYKQIAAPSWPNGVLRQVPAIMWPASTNWMAHVDGWTVVVFHDGIDGTWHGFAVEQIAHTVPEVRELNLKGQVRSVWCMDDHSTCDAAFDDVKRAITDAGGGTANAQKTGRSKKGKKTRAKKAAGKTARKRAQLQKPKAKQQQKKKKKKKK